ncbi:MAG: hypothetical protein IMF14_02640, partial [Proteobacteria bacterium]|nr:hypothetical protein [Pseudomonadota bacterium]
MKKTKLLNTVPGCMQRGVPGSVLSRASVMMLFCLLTAFATGVQAKDAVNYAERADV